MFRGKLTAAFLNKARKEGKPEISTQGRYCGGIKFYGDKWIPFDESNVVMDSINEFADAGYLEVEKTTNKEGRPPAESPTDLIEQAETELTEDAEIAAEVNQCRAIKADGEQCTRNALEGSLYCGTHKKLEE